MKLILTFFTLLAFVSFGQDTKSQGILDNLSKKIKSHTSFYVEFSANIKNTATGTDEDDTGKGWVQEDKYYASFGDNTIISNGKKTWTVVKEEKTVYEADADEEDDDMMNPKKLMTIWESGFKNKYGKEKELNGEAVHEIYLYPKSPGSVDYHTVVLYISKDKNELKKVLLKMKDGTRMTYRLTKYTANPEVNDSKFIYESKKYPGYTVVRDN
ncbi:MAG: outer membrane lipoprotein-sorting protein [Salibacteraceae bacterium]|jgi:outer membrane lipoprotein-sorting protein